MREISATNDAELNAALDEWIQVPPGQELTIDIAPGFYSKCTADRLREIIPDAHAKLTSDNFVITGTKPCP